MRNQRAYILDEALRPVPTNVPAQLFLGGIGVGDGYRNRDKLTAERFLDDPFNLRGGRMYMTGDCARWQQTGQIELLGRLDFQVKINGLRVELGEIEQSLLKCGNVEKAAVVRAGPLTNGKLVAFICGEANANLETNARAFLDSCLPPHMIPALIVLLETIPLSPNGKVDRSQLMKQAESLIERSR